jgi:hypothetical protein
MMVETWLVRRMFDLLGRTVRCPFANRSHRQCEAVPHIRGCVFGRVPESTSGPGLIIPFECEGGHTWQLRLIDNSAEIHLVVFIIRNPELLEEEEIQENGFQGER